MFVFSFKASTLKYIGVMSLCVLAIALTVVLMPTDNITTVPNGAVMEVSAQRKTGDFKNVKTSADRVAFLESYGWKVNPDSEYKSEVTIPEEFDAVYSDYNEIQKKEGLNLEKYREKKVSMYTYTVTNASEEAHATVLIYKNRVIGGDITASDVNGFSYGFSGKKQ